MAFYSGIVCKRTWGISYDCIFKDFLSQIKSFRFTDSKYPPIWYNNKLNLKDEYEEEEYNEFFNLQEDLYCITYINTDILFEDKDSDLLLSILSKTTPEGLKELDEFLKNILDKEDLEYYENILNMVEIKKLTGR